VNRAGGGIRYRVVTRPTRKRKYADLAGRRENRLFRASAGAWILTGLRNRATPRCSVIMNVESKKLPRPTSGPRKISFESKPSPSEPHQFAKMN